MSRLKPAGGEHLEGQSLPRLKIESSRAPFQITDLGSAKDTDYGTNEEILGAWSAFSRHHLRPSTLRAYLFEIRRFMEACGDILVTDVGAVEIQRYLGRFRHLCGNLAKRQPPFTTESTLAFRCLLSYPLDGCNLSCSGYKPLSREVVMHHLDALGSLFDFLSGRAALSRASLRDIRRHFGSRGRRRSPAARHLLSKQDVERLINRAPNIQRRTIYAALAKTGIRYSEMTELSIDEQYFQPETGWIRIPEFGGKRLGNRLVVVDRELLAILARYLQWRSHVTKQHAADHGRLFVTRRGYPLSADASDFNQRMLRADAARLGLSPIEPEPRRLASHSFRHFFSDQIKKNGIDPYWWHMLRGDLPSKNEAAYIHPTFADIQSQYLRYAPWLGVNSTC